MGVWSLGCSRLSSLAGSKGCNLVDLCFLSCAAIPHPHGVATARDDRVPVGRKDGIPHCTPMSLEDCRGERILGQGVEEKGGREEDYFASRRRVSVV
jgi:hypothetical protein